MPYATAEKRNEYERVRRARARQAGRELVQALQGKAIEVNPAARDALKAALKASGLDVPTVVAKSKAMLESVKPWGDPRDPWWTEDNDAQLKAVGVAADLLTRAGELPDDRTHQATAGGFSLHVHLDGLRPQDVGIDALPTVDVTPRKS